MTEKLFKVIILVFAFVFLCTAIFVLLLKGNSQFDDYYKTFFTLFANVVNRIEFRFEANFYLSMILYIIFTSFTNIVFINFVLSFMSNVIDEIGNTDNEEHRSNLIKTTEYLKFDPEYGIFKFLHAPLSVLNFPFQLLVLALQNKKYWNEFFCKISYFLISLIYFIFFLVINLIIFPYVYLRLLIKNLFQDIGEASRGKRIAFAIFLLPFSLIYYYFVDIYNFWVASYASNEDTDEIEEKLYLEEGILEIKAIFHSLAKYVSGYINENKKKKKFHVAELVGNWVLTPSSNNINDVSSPHRKYILQKKYPNIKEILNDPIKLNKLKQTHIAILKKSISQNSAYSHFKMGYKLVRQFCDENE
jgi:hypothetical protein